MPGLGCSRDAQSNANAASIASFRAYRSEFSELNCSLRAKAADSALTVGHSSPQHIGAELYPVRVTARIIGPILLATDRSSAYIWSALILFPRGPAFIAAEMGVVWFYKGPGIGLPEYFKCAITSASRLALPHIGPSQGSTQCPAEPELSSSSRSGRWRIFHHDSERSR
jgi:hypothetical protein